MNYEQAIDLAHHEIYKKEQGIGNLKACIKYLQNEKQSDDNLTQTPEQVLTNFGVKVPQLANVRYFD